MNNKTITLRRKKYTCECVMIDVHAIISDYNMDYIYKNVMDFIMKIQMHEKMKHRTEEILDYITYIHRIFDNETLFTNEKILVRFTADRTSLRCFLVEGITSLVALYNDKILIDPDDIPDFLVTRKF